MHDSDEDLDVFEDVAVGQREAANVFGLSQVAVQPLAEVHHVILSGVNLSQGGGEGAAPPLKAGLLTAPLLLKPRPLLLLIAVFTQLQTLTCIFRPKGLCLLPQKLRKKQVCFNVTDNQYDLFKN